MRLFDDNSRRSPEENIPPPAVPDQPAESGSSQPFVQPLGGDPLSYVPVIPLASAPSSNLPEDLRISWSWPHLLVFEMFVLPSLPTLHLPVFAYFSPTPPLPHNQPNHFL